MRQNVEHEINLEQLADQHHVGYSYFRKMFKKYTGVSPGQYHLQLKIMRAKDLLISTDKSIKEISYEHGFQSIYYFSKIFKKKVGTARHNSEIKIYYTIKKFFPEKTIIELKFTLLHRGISSTYNLFLI